MSENIRIYLADDHTVVRRGLEALISTHSDLELVGTAVDGVEAVRRVSKLFKN